MSDDVEVMPEAPNPVVQLVERNRALIDEIHALGGDIPPIVLFQVQLDALIDLLLPQGAPFREVFNVTVEDRLTQVFEHVKSQVIRQRLTIDQK